MRLQVVGVSASGHIFFHFLNYAACPYRGDAVAAAGEYPPGDGLWWFTGSIITLSMMTIFAGAREFVRRSKYVPQLTAHDSVRIIIAL